MSASCIDVEEDLGDLDRYTDRYIDRYVVDVVTPRCLWWKRQTYLASRRDQGTMLRRILRSFSKRRLVAAVRWRPSTMQAARMVR